MFYFTFAFQMVVMVNITTVCGWYVRKKKRNKKQKQKRGLSLLCEKHSNVFCQILARSFLSKWSEFILEWTESQL